jgi:hypothetical protein
MVEVLSIVGRFVVESRDECVGQGAAGEVRNEM